MKTTTAGIALTKFLKPQKKLQLNLKKKKKSQGRKREKTKKMFNRTAILKAVPYPPSPGREVKFDIPKKEEKIKSSVNTSFNSTSTGMKLVQENRGLSIGDEN